MPQHTCLEVYLTDIIGLQDLDYQVQVVCLIGFGELLVRSRAMENMIFSTCAQVFTSVLRSSAFVVEMW